jgi:hypothetical protein
MPGVRSVKQRFERLKQSLPQVAETSVAAVKEDYVSAQKSQLTEGLTSSGGTFRKYQSNAYARKKNAINPLPGLGNPDLKLTGAFYGGIVATVESGKLKIKSNDSKALDLEAKYGKQKIYGLQPEEMLDFVQNKVRPSFKQHILNNLKS